MGNAVAGKLGGVVEEGVYLWKEMKIKKGLPHQG